MSEFDLEAKEQNEYLLSAANKQLEEDEDEIKALNEMILQAKIYAIRDKQLQEKAEIEEEEKLEQQRLDEVLSCDK